MKHSLDNPVWAALTGNNQKLGSGNHLAKYFMPDISPIVAVANYSYEHFEALSAIVPSDELMVLFTNDKHLISSPLSIVNRIDGFQMLYENEAPAAPFNTQLVPLTEADIPQMLQLTQLNPPGPFLEKTIRFGGYEGIFDGSKLVAMAGRRLHSGNYIELSAICTHLEYTGKGYAGQLIDSQLRQILSEGKKPYLHVRADNNRAIGIYQRIGFVTRSEMFFYLLKKK